MEKDLPVPKPGDLFIGVIDLFAVLLPGVIAVALIASASGIPLPDGFAAVFAFLAAGWVVGHVLHGIGSWLDVLVYDPLFRPSDGQSEEGPPKKQGTPSEKTGTKSSSNTPHGWVWKYFHKNHELYFLATRMTRVPPQWKPQNSRDAVPGGMYQWARAWLSSESPEATATLDRLEADSKLFRSLTVLLIALLVVPFVIQPASGSRITRGQWQQVLHGHELAFILVTSAGVIFSLWRYCDLRNKMLRQCYLSYIQRRTELGGEAARVQRDSAPG
jgi:hypothetical protein